MNTNDLPPAAKLAALIEAGVVANPDLGHGKGRFLFQGKACALGFAALGAGLERVAIDHTNDGDVRAMEAAFGVPHLWTGMTSAVMDANDNGASLEAICLSLREGELAKVTA